MSPEVLKKAGITPGRFLNHDRLTQLPHHDLGVAGRFERPEVRRSALGVGPVLPRARRCARTSPRRVPAGTGCSTTRSSTALAARRIVRRASDRPRASRRVAATTAVTVCFVARRRRRRRCGSAPVPRTRARPSAGAPRAQRAERGTGRAGGRAAGARTRCRPAGAAVRSRRRRRTYASGTRPRASASIASDASNPVIYASGNALVQQRRRVARARSPRSST